MGRLAAWQKCILVSVMIIIGPRAAIGRNVARPVHVKMGNLVVYMFTGDPGRNNELRMLMRQDVVTALRITPSQCARIEAGLALEDDRLYEEYMAIGAAEGPDANPLVGYSYPVGTDPTTVRNIRNARTEACLRIQPQLSNAERDHVEAAIAMIHGFLSPAQAQRLVGLDLQFRGPLALHQDAVAARFHLAPDQKRQISNIWTEYKEARAAVGTDAHGPGLTSDRGEGKYRKLLGDKVLAVLTAEQRAMWRGLVGAAFRFDVNVRASLPDPSNPDGAHSMVRNPSVWFK